MCSSDLHHYDDTRRYIDGARSLSAGDRRQLFTGNVLKVYPRLAKALAARGLNPG